MKYVVELKYTNPAHDHVTLRRRVDTVNRIVEAKSEDEALNRAANQQRALGFKIQEAKIVEQPKAPVKTEQLTEATVKDLRTSLKAMDLRHGVDADKRDAGYKKSPAVAAAQKKFDAQAAGQGKMRPQAGTLAAKVAAKKLGEETEVQYIEEKLTAADPASKWISDFVASDNPKFAGKSKKERINMALGAYYSAKRGGDMKEGFDPSSKDIAKMLVKKHGAGNVTKQHILDLESDRDSFKGLDHDEIMKHVAKMDEAVSFGRSGGVMHYNPKTEKSETPKTGVNAFDKEGNLVGHYKDLETAKKFKPGHTYKTNKGVVEEVEQIDELSPFSNLGGRLFRAKQTLGMYGDAVKSGVNLVKGANAEKTDKRGFVTNRNDPDVQKHFDAAEKNTDSFKRRANAIARTVQQKNPEKAAAMRKLTTNEEVEQIDELKKSTLASYVNKAANQVRAKSGIAASFETQGARKRNPENKSAYMDVAKDFRQGAKKRLTGIEKATAKLAKEEIEAIKEANTRVVNKEVKKEKAAETAVAAARRAKNTKNKVEMEPKLDMNVAGSEKKYVTKV